MGTNQVANVFARDHLKNTSIQISKKIRHNKNCKVSFVLRFQMETKLSAKKRQGQIKASVTIRQKTSTTVTIQKYCPSSRRRNLCEVTKRKRTRRTCASKAGSIS